MAMVVAETQFAGFWVVVQKLTQQLNGRQRFRLGHRSFTVTGHASGAATR